VASCIDMPSGLWEVVVFVEAIETLRTSSGQVFDSRLTGGI